MGSIKIRYIFRLDKDEEEIFDLEFDRDTFELIPQENVMLPLWTKLDYHKCPHCPLDSEKVPTCPLAESFSNVVLRFDHIFSFHEIELEVITDERKVSCKTTAQRGISSLLGLIFATSGCPHTSYFKPMARFHLPLSSEHETIFRVTGMYLLAQYILSKEGKDYSFDLEGLKVLYDNLHLLNTKLADRIRDAVTSDSSVNGIILLDMLTKLMPIAIDRSLEDIKGLFSPYLKD
ncbi:MAG: hypothetical protein GTN99_01020 [Candidatus Dadabacteria bacterium]|nr:hypothetical protein [Candidatus Dadabacteria bacterium]